MNYSVKKTDMNIVLSLYRTFENVLASLKSKLILYLNAHVWPWKKISDLEADVDEAKNNVYLAERNMRAAFDIIGDSIDVKFYDADPNKRIVIHTGMSQRHTYGLDDPYASRTMTVETHTLVPHVENSRFYLGSARMMTAEAQRDLRNLLEEAATYSLRNHIRQTVDGMLEGKYDEHVRKNSYPF